MNKCRYCKGTGRDPIDNGTCLECDGRINP